MNLKSIFIAVLIVLISACSQQEKKRITIFYTADEHGWFNESSEYDGAAALLQQWKEVENYSDADSFLVLSGGDMWTGSSPSTWFQGRSMVEIMNGLGYDAAALGNHEFDFKLDTLLSHSKRSDFPFLAANLTEKDGSIPAYIRPYTIVEANGLKVGLIGLSNLETPNTASPTEVKNLLFHPYEASVRNVFPEVIKAGADLVFIVGHICEREMESLVPMANELGISLITGGHCHKQIAKMQDGVLMIETWPHLSSYIKVVIEYDEKLDKSTVLSYKAVKNQYEGRNEEMDALVTNWEDKANEDLAVPIAYTEKGIKRGTPEMKKITCDSWLLQIEEADVAIVNTGGIRQDIAPGEITMGTLLGLLPFSNQIVKMSFTGKELRAFLDTKDDLREKYIISGVENFKIEADHTYQVLTTDFLHSLTETKFGVYDPKPSFVGKLYREPSIAWVLSTKSDVNNPIDKYLK